MGRSISRVPVQPAGSFRHEISGSTFTITTNGSEMVQTVERGGLSSTHQVAYVIGSGNAATGYLIQIGSYLFQSPISYYTDGGRWDVAPGYEENPHPEFDRPVTAECLWCHSGRPAPVASTVNRYESEVFEQDAISCDRCHGPTQRHLENPESATILNPAKLGVRERDSVCEQCHLSGEARVLNPGGDFGDFQPGMKLEDVFSVYLYDRAPGSTAFKVVSHVEQLASSQCAQLSGGELWCGTCHNPHEAKRDRGDYRAACESCHDSVSLAGHDQPLGGCVECHMPRKQSYDSGHSAFTDHRIARRPNPDEGEKKPQTLRAWRDPVGPLAQRNLGLAYARVAELNQSDYQGDQALRNLMGAMKYFEGDAELPYALGKLLVAKGKAELAREFFDYVITRDPRNALRLHGLANAYEALGNGDQAVEALERAIKLDPMLESSYRALAALHMRAGRKDQAVATWGRYLEVNPESIYARQAKAALEEPAP